MYFPFPVLVVVSVAFPVVSSVIFVAVPSRFPVFLPTKPTSQLLISHHLTSPPYFQSIPSERFILQSAMGLKALSLGHVYAFGMDEFGHLPSLFFFLVSFGSDGLAAVEELCSVMVLSDVSLACSGLFIACDAGSLYLPFLFSFYLVLMSSSFDGCLAVEEHPFRGYEIGSMEIGVFGAMSCWLLQMVAESTSSARGGLASVGFDLLAVVVALFQGLTVWISFVWLFVCWAPSHLWDSSHLWDCNRGPCLGV